MVGATMIESNSAGPITARSMMELLNAAYSLHPALSGRRRSSKQGWDSPRPTRTICRVSSAREHHQHQRALQTRFLLAPAMAMLVADMILNERRATR